MSMNQRYKNGDNIDVPVPVGTVAGDFVLVGGIKGVANIDRQDDGTASITRVGSFIFSVKAVIAGPTNSAIAVGDPIYYDAADTPKMNKDNTGTLIGHALTTLASGATGNVEVLLDE
jgi:predicted RecA/RadA family phage recombinase